MDCDLNFVCPLYPACEQKSKAELCAVHMEYAEPKPKKFIHFPAELSESPPDELIMFDPYDLDDPTP